MASSEKTKKQIGVDADYTRNSEYLIVPEDILLGRNGRWQDHTEEDIERMYQSFREERQLQAVEVRKVQGGKVELVLGYRRLKAALLFNQRHPEDPMRLRCKIVTCNDEEALRRNVTENRVRSETSQVDDAHNQRTFREVHGWTDAQIAKFYDISESQVSKLTKIPGLAFAIQTKIHRKELTLDAALGMAELPAEEQKTLLTEGESNGGVTTEQVRKRVRVKKIDEGGAVARSMKEVKEFIEGLTGPAESKGLRDWCQQMLWFIQGKVTDEKMADFMRDLLPKTEAEDEE